MFYHILHIVRTLLLQTHLFGPIKEHLGEKRFCNNEEVMQDVQEWLQRQPKDFFLNDIRKLPDQWCKCIANQGDYVEK